MACAVLHNLAIAMGEPDPDDAVDPVEDDDGDYVYDGPHEGRLVRDSFVRQYFT